MYLKLKLAALVSTLIIAGAAKTTDEVVVAKTEQEATTDAAAAAADADAADTTNRELYGKAVIDRRRTDCPDDLWCETYEQCMNSDAAKAFGINGNGLVTDNSECIGGCALKQGGRVSWFVPADFDTFKNCAPSSLERVCCAPESPTASPTWMDDSWGKADTWSGGNKKGWGGWEPSMSGWNHKGWHTDGWTDDGWNEPQKNSWGDDWNKKSWGDDWNKPKWGDDWNKPQWNQKSEWNQWGNDWNSWNKYDSRKNCNWSDCCMAYFEGSNFNPFRRYLNTENSSRMCRIPGTNGREKCNVKGYCYATEEGCMPSDCNSR